MPNLKIDFRVRKDDNRGIYYSETKRAIIYLGGHETIEDLYKTLDHEVFHHCFEELGETDNMDEDMEEQLILSMQWAPLDLV